MQDHKPDPKALSQTQSPATLVNDVPVGVKSVREAFAAAPVANPDSTLGIRLHFQVDEQVTFTPPLRPTHQSRQPGRVHPLHWPGHQRRSTLPRRSTSTPSRRGTSARPPSAPTPNR